MNFMRLLWASAIVCTSEATIIKIERLLWNDGMQKKGIYLLWEEHGYMRCRDDMQRVALRAVLQARQNVFKQPLTLMVEMPSRLAIKLDNIKAVTACTKELLQDIPELTVEDVEKRCYLNAAQVILGAGHQDLERFGQEIFNAGDHECVLNTITVADIYDELETQKTKLFQQLLKFHDDFLDQKKERIAQQSILLKQRFAQLGLQNQTRLTQWVYTLKPNICNFFECSELKKLISDVASDLFDLHLLHKVSSGNTYSGILMAGSAHVSWISLMLKRLGAYSFEAYGCLSQDAKALDQRGFSILVD